MDGRPFNPSVKGREQVAEEIRLRLEGYRDNEGRQIPGIYFFSTCVHLIRTLPSITHDKYNPEKYDTNCEDHAVDAIGYGLLSRPYRPAQSKNLIRMNWTDGTITKLLAYGEYNNDYL